MAHWLVKTEPSTYSFGDLLREKRTVWSGVKNALAARHLRAMKKGDTVLIYHTGTERQVVGTGEVVKEGGDADEPVIAAGDALPRPVLMAEIRAEKRLADWGLVTFGRLSVVPTTRAQFEAVMYMSQSPARTP